MFYSLAIADPYAQSMEVAERAEKWAIVQLLLLFAIAAACWFVAWYLSRIVAVMESTQRQTLADDSPPEQKQNNEPLTFQCDLCGSWLKVSKERVGQQVKCPKCSKMTVAR